MAPPERSPVDPDAVARPEFLPDPALSRAEMESLQRDLAATATFADDHGIDPTAVAIDEPADLTEGLPDARQESLPGTHRDAGDPDAPVVVGVDQAFLTPDDGEDRAVSAAVAIRDGAVIEYASATTPLSIPYVPGLLAFREGEPMLAALDALDAEPDLLVCDGSGRIHFREAGVATHVGVLLDVPSVGVAKRLLCGEPESTTEERPEGWRTPIRADDSVETIERGADAGDVAPVIGHAFQSRQYPNSRRVNPLYVSSGHRVSAETTVELVDALCAGYKLPEPTRLADAYADAVKSESD
ncbi:MULTISPECIES: endonuclease V [unclassified Halorubrum]|uniref:endonuclease V n=1 Tax=unclassified Halorubrum TaxID=2642239 RepID=UPI000B980429|nr:MULTISPECIES: endonuclease V [unclassified Halorubrum]OYR40113.1 endonuclease V [Halorubrum sp. Eb13]OYR50554.1 endonuclease V [Halorubrum sp. Ea8]OYR53718.1 endonuclease V [Halorubrum sp. Ea1]